MPNLCFKTIDLDPAAAGKLEDLTGPECRARETEPSNGRRVATAEVADGCVAHRTRPERSAFSPSVAANLHGA